jgi:pimeloyl-ACP methyl ester carboxylesterase
MKKRRGYFLTALFVILVCAGCAGPPEGDVMSADEVSIRYTVAGKGEPALVFVHGWSCDKSYWEAQVGHFSKSYRVITLDLAGHGDSGLERHAWTIEAFAEDVVAVVKTLDLERIILVGHSMGGSVNLEAAQRIPERVIGIIGVDTYHSLEPKFTKEQIDQFLALFKDDFPVMTKNFVRSMFPHDADTSLVERVASDMAAAPAEVAIGAMTSYLNYDPSQALEGSQIPIYCINSDKFPTDVDTAKRLAHSFEVEIVAGRGHFLMMEDPKTFNRLLEKTVETLSAGG